MAPLVNAVVLNSKFNSSFVNNLVQSRNHSTKARPKARTAEERQTFRSLIERTLVNNPPWADGTKQRVQDIKKKRVR